MQTNWFQLVFVVFIIIPMLRRFRQSYGSSSTKENTRNWVGRQRQQRSRNSAVWCASMSKWQLDMTIDVWFNRISNWPQLHGKLLRAKRHAPPQDIVNWWIRITHRHPTIAGLAGSLSARDVWCWWRQKRVDQIVFRATIKAGARNTQSIYENCKYRKFRI